MPTTPTWISTLSTSSISTDMTAADINGVVSEAGLSKLLSDLDATLSPTSTLTAAEFADLKTIDANLSNGVSTSSYVSYVFDALVNGNAANTTWTGGAASSVKLGNLAVGANATQLAELTGKWFLGTDLPSSALNSTPTLLTYSTVSSPLFGASGPVVSDVNQGQIGDCWLLATCAEVAAQNPSDISSMFTNNGNGSYGVRFYMNGVAEYVTVNTQLADGGTILNSGADIWASLAEKAFAQFQAAGPDTGSTVTYGNSYNSIGNSGSPDNALEALTGCSIITDYTASGLTWNALVKNASLTTTSVTPGETTSALLQVIIAGLAAHDDEVVSSYTSAIDSSNKSTLISDHLFSLYGYDSITGNLELRNPWGVQAGQYWDTTFEVSLSTLLGDGDTISIDNASIPNSNTGQSLPAAPTITGAHTSTTSSATAITPFTGVTIADTNNGSPVEALTITLSNGGAGGALAGTGLSGGASGVYKLSGTAATVTSELDALIFTPVAGITATTIGLSDLSSAFGTAATDTTTMVNQTTAPASAPTITGAHLSVTSSNAGITPFTGVTITDANAGSPVEALTITVSSGGTLSGTGLTSGVGGVYRLSGSAAAITGELDALIFAPTAATGATTISLSDMSNAFAGATTDNATTVIETTSVASVHANDISRCGDVTGANNFTDILDLVAGYNDLIAAFGTNQAASQAWFNDNQSKENRATTFDGLDYIASYGDLINAFKGAGSEHAVMDAGASHYITNGHNEGRVTTFNGLDYIASYSDLIKAFGVNGDAGADHYIEHGVSEGRTTSFDGLDYIASYSDLIKAFGANEQAGAAHYIANGSSEGRTTTFDGLDYIAGYTDLMKAFGANNDAGASHFITNGFSEGRSAAPFNVAAYESSHTDLMGKYASNDAFLTAYIGTYATTGKFLT